MNFSFIPVALAAQTGAENAQTAGTVSSIFLLLGFVIIFYFMLWRPQSKRAKEHQDLISQLKKDDEVVTNGGVLGKITKVTDQFVTLEIAERIEIIVQKQAIASLVPKGTIKSV